MLSEQLLAAWCRRHLGAAPGRVLFRRRHLSEVIAVELADKRRVVVKARPFDERIAGCVAVQAALAQAGFPCPVPLAGPVRVDDLAVTAEDLIPDDENRAPADRAEPFAALLAWLIGTAPAVTAVPPLIPSPPWTGWDHPGSGMWPDRDDDGRNLNEVTGPAWVDEAARLVRRRMRTCDAPDRIGHGDWESQNIQWRHGKVRAVHDWDSVIAQPEVAIVGLAAAVWPAAGGPGEAASITQTADFLDAYQAAAGAAWTTREVQLAWTAGLWVRLFNAKKDAARGGGPQLDRLAAEIRQRLTRAGLHTGDWHGPRSEMARSVSGGAPPPSRAPALERRSLCTPSGQRPRARQQPARTGRGPSPARCGNHPPRVTACPPRARWSRHERVVWWPSSWYLKLMP